MVCSKRVNYIHAFFIFLRIRDWLHILGLTVLGISFYSGSSLLTYKSLLALVISSLYLAHGFSLNNYFDVTIDRYIGKDFFLLDQIFHKRFLALSYLLFLINCVISFKISSIVLCLVIIGSITGLIYSAPPLRLKRITFLNILLNSLGFSFIFLIGFASVSNSITPAALMMALLFIPLFIPLQIIHQISHSEADKKGDIQSIYNRYGFKVTAHFFNFSLMLLLSWSLLIGALYNKYIYIFYPTFLFCLSFFYFMRRIKKSKKNHSEFALKTRLLFRKICMLYGIIMFFIFYFIN